MLQTFGEGLSSFQNNINAFLRIIHIRCKNKQKGRGEGGRVRFREDVVIVTYIIWRYHQPIVPLKWRGFSQEGFSKKKNPSQDVHVKIHQLAIYLELRKQKYIFGNMFFCKWMVQFDMIEKAVILQGWSLVTCLWAGIRQLTYIYVCVCIYVCLFKCVYVVLISTIPQEG